MESTPKQYDSLLGGLQDLPSSAHLLKIAAARFKEIQAMRQSLKSTSSVKLAFQKLPVHMRRRIMSHTVKRLPRRLRLMHMSQLQKSGLPPKQKRPSRKYRRRPRNMLEEHERRRRRAKWLETHVWHAKRFHMVEKWGYRLADRPCDKAFRACYRATAKHCLLQDISYFSCVEIEGPREVLIGKMKEVCEPCAGLSVGAKAFVNGNREGSTVLFKPGSKRAIGMVLFNWKPFSDRNRNALWLWLHPAFYAEAVEVLVDIFHLTCNTVESDVPANKIYANEQLSVRLSELKFELNRFRLTGPLSHAVLRESLKVVDANHACEWFKSYLTDDSNRQSFANQTEQWKSLSGVTNPAELSPHIILSLIVSDPRFHLPTKRTKAINCAEHAKAQKSSHEADISISPLWEKSIRDTVKGNRLSNAAIAELRSQLLVPGTELEEPGAPVPVMLIQRPGSNEECLGYGAGWDIIIPSAWAQAFWISFVMRGARVGGLRESASITFEMGHPDVLMPDTSAGKQEEENVAATLKERYFRLPPNKRTNYNKYAIVNPFCCNWNLLVGEWMGRKVEDVHVLRDKKLLREIQQLLDKNVKQNNEIDFNRNYIVPVKLKIRQRGCPKQFSVICLPEVEDLKNEPFEPKADDVNQVKRKQLRQEHKDLLKTLKRRRKRAKLKGEKIAVDVEMLMNYRNQMRKLWLPEAETIRNSCSRPVIGFVTKGGFRYSNGYCCGVGYIALSCLPHLFAVKCENNVLIRNTTSRQYRLSQLDIVM